MLRTLAAASITLLALVAGCGSTAQPCAPGQQVACACPGGGPGAQACNADGSGFLDCQCGGSGTSSSASSTTGAGGAASTSSAASTTGAGGVGGASSSASTTGAGGASTASSSSTSSSGTGGGPACGATWSHGFAPSNNGGTVELAKVRVDSQGNVITVGSFVGTTDFGGGALVQQGVARNLFVAKFDCAGTPLWSKRFGAPDNASENDFLYGMVVDSTGAILLTGSFGGSLDFGAGPIVSQDISDGFMAKLDASGNGVWTKRFGGTQNSDVGFGVAVDPAGNAYFTGAFVGAQNFGGGVIGNDMQQDFFAAKFDSAGNHLWSKVFGPDGGLSAIALDPAGNLILCGSAKSMPDFGGGKVVGALYVAKLDSSGGFLMSKGFSGASGKAVCQSVAADASGAIVLTGQYGGTLDFGGGAIPVNSGFGTSAAFVAKLTGTGAHVFSKGTGTNTILVTIASYAVAVDGGGNVYVTGGFADPLDFGGGPVMSAGSADVFVTKLGPTGAFGWTKSFGDMQLQVGFGLALDASGDPVIGGVYNGAIDFGSGVLPVVGAASGSGAFLAKLLP